MTAIRDDEVEDLAYELRRRIAPILGNAELTLDGAFGSVTPEQRDALEEVVASSEELGAVISHALESDDVEEVIESDGGPLPSADPEDSPPIAVSVDDEFDAILADQLERSGYNVHENEEPDGPHHAIVDCGVPTREGLEALSKRAQRDDTLSLTVVSTLDIDSLPSPTLGVSAIALPDAPAALLGEELPELVGQDRVEAALVGPIDERFRKTLAGVREVRTLEVDPSAEGTAAALETIAASDGDLAVFDAGAVDGQLLSALRDPTNPAHLPLVAVGPTPTGDDWVEIPGHRQFAHRPLSTVELAGEVLVALSRSEATVDE